MSSLTNPLTPPTGRFYKAAGPALLAHLGRLRVLLGDAETSEGQPQVLMGTVPDPIDAGRPMVRGHPEGQRNVLPLNAVTSPVTVGATLNVDGAAGALTLAPQVGGGGGAGRALRHLMQVALVQAQPGEPDRSTATGSSGTVGARMTEVVAPGRPDLSIVGGGAQRALSRLVQAAMVQAQRRGALQALVATPARRLQALPSNEPIASSQPFTNIASTAGRSTHLNLTAPFIRFLDSEHPPAADPTGPLHVPFDPAMDRGPAIHFANGDDWTASSRSDTAPLGSPAIGQGFSEEMAPDDDFLFEERLRQALVRILRNDGLRHGLALGERPS